MIGGIDLKAAVEQTAAQRWTHGNIKWTCDNWPQFVDHTRRQRFHTITRKTCPTGHRYIARCIGGHQVSAPEPGIAVLAAALLEDGAEIPEIMEACREQIGRPREYRLSPAERKAIVDRGKAGERATDIHKDYPNVTAQAIG